MDNSYKRLLDLVTERRYNTLNRKRGTDYGKSARRASDRTDSPVKPLSPEEQKKLKSILPYIR